MSEEEFNKLEKIEKMARNNRAVLILIVTLSPLLIFISFFSLDLHFSAGEIKELNLKSREISIPVEIKTLVSIFGLGGLFGLSKEQIIKLLNKEK